MHVQVTRSLEQVADGTHYKGTITLGKTLFNFDFKFGVPISRLGSMQTITSPSEGRRVFQITVEKNKKKIELTDDEFGFFLQMLLDFTIDFYSSRQIRDGNEGMLGELLKVGGMMANFGMSATMGMTSTQVFEFPANLCELLVGPKFGCTLTV